MSRVKSILFRRRLAQIAVLLGFIVIPVLNLHAINVLSGNLLSFNFGPLTVVDPLAALQVMLGSLSVTATTLLGAGFILLPALILGPVFCSWICPFGFLSEIAHGRRSNVKNSPKPSSRGFKIKLTICALGLASILLFLPFPILNQLSMPGWYTRIMQHLVLYGPAALTAIWPVLALILAVLALEKYLKQRLWCRYVCPQSLLLNLSGLILPARFQVRFERKKCTCPAKDRLCGKSCSLSLYPRSPGTAQRLQCTNCGDCVDACRSRGKALSLGFGKITEAAPPPQTPPAGE